MYIRRIVSAAGTALAIGVCVSITYISRDVDHITLLFNLGMLAVMLCITAAAYFAGMRKLIQASRALQRGTDTIRTANETGRTFGSDSAPLFQNQFLDECYAQYSSMIRHNPDSACDIQNYVNEESIETFVHRGILECIPDILTSLGILGTFVGLVMGLREFDPSGYEQMAGSVTPLINGIKVAFITSIYGIALSLSFSFNLRSEFSNLTAKLEEFLDTFYLRIRPPYEVDSLSRLLEHQKGQEEVVHDLTGIFVEQMGKSFEQSITPAFARMTDSFRQVTDTFMQSQEALLTNVCQTVTRQMRTELVSDFDQIRKTVDELGRSQASYTDFMDRTLLQMQHSLKELQDSIQQSQSSLADSMKASRTYLSDSISQLAAAQESAYQINQEQKNAYQDYIRFMYQCIERFSDIWEKNSEELKVVSDEIARMGPVRSSDEMKQQLSRISEQLSVMQQQSERTFDASDSASAETQQEMYEKTMKKLNELEELLDRPLLFRRKTSSKR